MHQIAKLKKNTCSDCKNKAKKKFLSGRRKIATSPYISKKGFAGPSPYSNRTRKTSTKTYTDAIKV